MLRRVAVPIALVTGALLSWAPAAGAQQMPQEPVPGPGPHEERHLFPQPDGQKPRAPESVRRRAPSPRVNARTIYFDSGRATLKPASKKALRDVVGTLRADPTSTVRLEGHTDSVGAERNNKTLARARATTVATYLKRHGIGGRRIHAVGMGETGPVADNATQQGRAKNRRVEIRVDTRTASVR